MQSVLPQVDLRVPRLLPAALLALAATVCTADREAFVLVAADLRLWESWRLLTCHLAHLGPEHLLLNLVPYPFIAAYAPLGRRTLVLALACSLTVWIAKPDISSYGGLSGVLHGVVADAALLRATKARSARQVGIHAAVLLVVVGKVIAEVVTGSTLLSPGIELGGVPVPIAHLGGVLGAILLFSYAKVRSAVGASGDAMAEAAAAYASRDSHVSRLPDRSDAHAGR